MLNQSQKVRLGFFAIVIFGIFNRIYNLAERPLHHDEAIHSTLSYHWFNNSTTGYYKYDPTYHGTFLYATIRSIYELFGVGVVQARLFPLVFGLAVWCLPLVFRRFIGLKAMWISLVGIAVSPLLTYYCRFVVHDMPTIFFTFLGIGSVLRFFARRGSDRNEATRWLWLGALSFGILQAIKLISFINFFLFAVFGCLYLLHDFVQGRTADWKKFLREEASSIAIAFAIFLFSYGFINTAFFREPAAFWDGLFGRNLDYWAGQHAVERVKGPVAYHLYSMLLHELPALLAVLGATFAATYRTKYGRYFLAALILVAGFTVPNIYPLGERLTTEVAAFLDKIKVRQSIDIFLYLLCGVGALLGTWQFLKEGKKAKAFACFWTFGSLAIFSFAGEKGPWLCVHIAFPMVAYASLIIADYLDKPNAWIRDRYGKIALIGLASLAIAYQARIGIWVNHITDGEPTDVLSQVHNTRDVKRVLDWMRTESYKTGETPDKISIATLGETTWAFYFYLLAEGFHTYKFDASALDGKERFVMADEGAFKQIEAKMQTEGYRFSKLNLNGWYVPEDFKPTWFDWAAYAWNRKAKGIGTRPMYVFFKPL